MLLAAESPNTVYWLWRFSQTAWPEVSSALELVRPPTLLLSQKQNNLSAISFTFKDVDPAGALLTLHNHVEAIMVACSALSIWISPGCSYCPRGLAISSSLVGPQLAEHTCKSGKWMWKCRCTATFLQPSCCWSVWMEVLIFLHTKLAVFWNVICIFRIWEDGIWTSSGMFIAKGHQDAFDKLRKAGLEFQKFEATIWIYSIHTN